VISKARAMEKKDFKFDKRAAKYDDKFEGRLSRVFYQLVYDNVSLPGNAEVLDVGCGTGTVLKTLSETHGIVGHGIDVEPKMLEVARKKCPQMDIRECSCDSTPFADSTFDAVITCMAYHHFPDKEAFAREALRILKPGGTLYVADPKFPKIIRKIVNRLARRFNGEFFSSDELVERFKSVGFVPVTVKKRSYGQIVVMRKG